jgi:hypothetical protein
MTRVRATGPGSTLNPHSSSPQVYPHWAYLILLSSLRASFPMMYAFKLTPVARATTARYFLLTFCCLCVRMRRTILVPQHDDSTVVRNDEATIKIRSADWAKRAPPKASLPELASARLCEKFVSFSLGSHGILDSNL